MDSFASLLLLCVAMFIGSMAAGVVPVYCALSPSRVRVLTVFGAGLLVGTALIVIIPEGVHMWYEAEAQAKAVVQAAVTVAGSSVQQGAVSLAVAATAAAVVAPSPSKLAERGTVLAQVPPPATGFLRGAANTGLAAPKVGVVGHADAHASHDHTHADGEHDHDHSHEEGGGHRMIGASLASGFAFMLIVDTIGGGHGHGHGSHGHGSHSHSHGGGSGGSGSSLGEDAKSDSGASVLPHAHGSHNKKEDDAVVDDAGGGGGGGGSSSDAQHRTRNAAMGLLVHAAVDGIALGAAAASNQGSVELLVFVAIMLHKAPAAFGLSSYLVHSGASHEDVKSQLVKFSAAAPCSSLLTFYVLRLGVMHASLRMLAVCFMFSGGTFLFVSAAHILPEIQATTDDPSDRQAKFRNLWIMVGGLLLPLLINIEHGH